MISMIKNRRIAFKYIDKLAFYLGWCWFISAILFFLTFHEFYRGVLFFSTIAFFISLSLLRIKEKIYN